MNLFKKNLIKYNNKDLKKSPDIIINLYKKNIKNINKLIIDKKNEFNIPIVIEMKNIQKIQKTENENKKYFHKIDDTIKELENPVITLNKKYSKITLKLNDLYIYKPTEQKFCDGDVYSNKTIFHGLDAIKLITEINSNYLKEIQKLELLKKKYEDEFKILKNKLKSKNEYNL